MIFLPIFIANEPQNEEAPRIIIPSLSILFAIINPVQDLLEVILWVFVFKEISIISELKKGDI